VPVLDVHTPVRLRIDQIPGRAENELLGGVAVRLF
jgi:hypothetical protein